MLAIFSKGTGVTRRVRADNGRRTRSHKACTLGSLLAATCWRTAICRATNVHRQTYVCVLWLLFCTEQKAWSLIKLSPRERLVQTCVLLCVRQ